MISLKEISHAVTKEGIIDVIHSNFIIGYGIGIVFILLGLIVNGLTFFFPLGISWILHLLFDTKMHKILDFFKL